ncbi:elicitor-responsive protein 1 isoform X2 [Magnolia sinica]|uniref:elicitor-responsive protein 1 isoform X2 n=1 Tax=Magnolia sinica TaxID=86752 RepID=UPI00265AF896|nr:elicitor-responsive protein 1 isoform X2 [Magnolia sinica]
MGRSGILEVQLVDARGLGNTDLFAKMDPYVVIRYKSEERKSSVARGGDPKWNERFTFRVQFPGADDEYKLILRIMDKDTFSADDFVGEATIYLKDVLALGMENGIAEIRPCKHRVLLADRTYCGEIQVGLTFTPKREEAGERDYGGWKHSSFE